MFHILGPVEIGPSERRQSAGPPRQQAVLAVLIAHDGALVPIETIIDQAWDGHPPASARTAVHVYVSRLRRILAGYLGEPAAHRLLDTKARGYQLRVEPDQLDAARLKTLVAQAQQAMRADQPGPARQLAGTALNLWRGPVLGGLVLESVRPTLVTPLNELRLAAHQTKIDAELALGRHEAVIVELRRLITAQPYREAFRAQLMLALYRCGRQAEALALFEQTRRQLRDKFGADPGAGISRLHRAMLRGDRSLAAPPRAAVPAQLPPDVARFTGRRAESRRLVRLLSRGGPAVCAIDGPGGVGKSALAVHVAHLLKNRFPDGQLYVNLHGNTLRLAPLEPIEVLGRWLRALGVEPGRVPVDVDEASAQLRSLTSGRRMLVVCDDAADAAQIRPLLPASPDCAVLVTSRRVLATLENATHTHLDVLSDAEATTLLGRLVGPAAVADQAAAAAVVHRCGRLPLAVRIAAALLAAHPGTPVRALAERLSDEHNRLDELAVEDLAIRASLAVSYRDLDAGEPARMFRLLGLLDLPDIPLAVAAALAGLPAAEAENALKSLVDAQLVQADPDGRHSMHDLVRLFARERAEHEEPARDEAVAGALGAYLAGASSATLLLDPKATRRVTAPAEPAFTLGTPADAAAWLDAEHANLVAATRQAASLPGSGRRLAIQLAAALYRPLHIRGRWRELIAVRQLAADVAHEIGDRAGEGLAYEDLGFTYVQLVRPEQALSCVERALAIWRDLGHPTGQQSCLNILGIIHRRAERFDEAIACLEQGLRICRETGDRRGQAGILNTLGLVYQHSQRFESAVDCHGQGIALHRSLANRDGEAVALANLGWAQFRSGNPEQAIACHERSLAITRDLGHRYQQAESLWGIGQAEHLLGRTSLARSSWRESLAILQEIGELTPDEAAAILSQPVPPTPGIIAHNT